MKQSRSCLQPCSTHGHGNLSSCWLLYKWQRRKEHFLLCREGYVDSHLNPFCSTKAGYFVISKCYVEHLHPLPFTHIIRWRNLHKQALSLSHLPSSVLTFFGVFFALGCIYSLAPWDRHLSALFSVIKYKLMYVNVLNSQKVGKMCSFYINPLKINKSLGTFAEHPRM